MKNAPVYSLHLNGTLLRMSAKLNPPSESVGTGTVRIGAPQQLGKLSVWIYRNCYCQDWGSTAVRQVLTLDI